MDRACGAQRLIRRNGRSVFSAISCALHSEAGVSQLRIKKDGNDILIAFNPKFLLDALKVIDDEEIDIYLMNIKSPCIIKDKAETYMYLILPLNFNPD